MSSEIRFRAARLADAETLAHFNTSLAWETEHLALDKATVRAGVEAVLVDAAKGRYFVAEADGQVVGQCSVTFEWSDWRNGQIWWFQSVYVAAAWRGRGVFRGLFEHVRQDALREGVVGLRLYVERENLGAQKAYHQRGMRPTNYLVYERDLRGESPPA